MTIEKLLERAEAAMLVRDWETLLDCARRLQMARHPQGYTFQAFAQRSAGQLDAAVETLWKGVRQLPREMELRTGADKGDIYVFLCEQGARARMRPWVCWTSTKSSLMSE